MEVLHKYLPKILTSVVLISVLFLTFWIRIQGVERIPEGQFTGHDPYVFYWQALTISEKGYLPARDMHRWQPLGRDNGQVLPLFSYAIAYAHKAVGWISPKLTLYHIQLYASPVCFTLGLGVLMFFLMHAYGVLFAATVGILLATLPGSIDRSTAGFGDRDAWCWMMAIMVVTSYLWKEQTDPGWRRWLGTVLCGFTVFLGGWSWEGFGVFVLIIIAVEFWKFCTTDTETRLKEYFLWVLMFVPGLLLLSPAYRSGYGFSTHVAALMLAPSLVLLVLRGVRDLLLTYFENLRQHARELALGLSLLAIAAALCYFFFQKHTFEMTAFAFRKSRLMQSIGELDNPDYLYWTVYYGTVFALGSLGLIFCSRRLGMPARFSVDIPLIFFFLTTFLREIMNNWIGDVWCDRFFLVSLGLTCLALGLACLRYTAERSDKNELVVFAAIAWFLLWVSLARSGKRHDFFIGIPLAYGTAWLLWEFTAPLVQRLVQKIPSAFLRVWNQWVAASIVLVALIGILFWSPLGGHARFSVAAASKLRGPVPGEGGLKDAYQWLKENTQDAVVSTIWDYGIQLNIFGGVKNVIDTDHYLPHWIYLYCRHVFCAQTEQEALSFLKTHGATHLFLTRWGATSRAGTLSFIGSNENDDRVFRFHQLSQEAENTTETSTRLISQETPLDYIDVAVPTPGKRTVTAQFKDGTNISRDFTLEEDTSTQKAIDLENGGILLSFDAERQIEKAEYISPIGWNSLAIKLYFRGGHNEAFIRVYPEDADSSVPVKIWEIHYPPDIKTDEKYLATEPEKPDEK